MKIIITKIPNNEKKCNYALIHIDTFNTLQNYLDELSDWVKEGPVEGFVSEFRNELEGLRRL